MAEEKAGETGMAEQITGLTMRISEPLTIYNIDAIRKQLQDGLAKKGPLEVSLADVEQFDTTGCQLLVSASLTAEAGNRTLVYSGMKEDFVEFTEMLGLKDFLFRSGQNSGL